MVIGVPAESADNERRVALVPDVVRRLAPLGVEVEVEAGAGGGAMIPDSLYEEAGARIVDGDAAWGAAVVVKVAPPSASEIARLHPGATLIAFLNPLAGAETINALAAVGVTAFAMESIPRISRAQAMDALSSQANVAG
jgi:NAD(P) transhydrogenase subunit alpha